MARCGCASRLAVRAFEQVTPQGRGLWPGLGHGAVGPGMVVRCHFGANKSMSKHTYNVCSIA